MLDAGRGDLEFDRNSDHYAAMPRCGSGDGLSSATPAARSAAARGVDAGAPDGPEIVGCAAKSPGTADDGHVPELSRPGRASRSAAVRLARAAASPR